MRSLLVHPVRLCSTPARLLRGSLLKWYGRSVSKIFATHSTSETTTGKLFTITQRGPRIFSRQTLIDKKYPHKPSMKYYLVYKVKKVSDVEFANVEWDITKLKNYKKGRGSVLPFAVSLAELMNVVKGSR
jgi:hypothetical protein